MLFVTARAGEATRGEQCGLVGALLPWLAILLDTRELLDRGTPMSLRCGDRLTRETIASALALTALFVTFDAGARPRCRSFSCVAFCDGMEDLAEADADPQAVRCGDGPAVGETKAEDRADPRRLSSSIAPFVFTETLLSLKDATLSGPIHGPVEAEEMLVDTPCSAGNSEYKEGLSEGILEESSSRGFSTADELRLNCEDLVGIAPLVREECGPLLFTVIGGPVVEGDAREALGPTAKEGEAVRGLGI